MELVDLPLSLIFVVSLIVVLGSAEIGRRIGLHMGARTEENFATLEASTLSLVALIIGFTFAMALSRADARREAVVVEANAIGTAALRARLLPPPHDSEVLKLLREYVQTRLDVAKRPANRAAISTAIVQSNVVHEALWQQAKMMSARDSSMVPTGLFIEALNDMIDSQGIRLAAVYNHLPNVVVFTLYGIAVAASAFSGYARGVQGLLSRLPLYVVGCVVCIVILQIQDLDRTDRGLITISQQPMIDLNASLAIYQ